jgi:hypothetical protein
MIKEEFFQDVLFEAAKGADSLGKVRFMFAQGDIPNKNNRVYKREFLQKEVTRLQDLIDSDNQVWGSPAHPEGSAHLRVNDISHRMTKFWMTPDGKAWGEAEILPTQQGKNLSVVLRKGRIGVSLRAEGGVHFEDGTEIVNDDAKIIGVDFSLAPSFEGAVSGELFESAELPAEREKAELEMSEEEENKALSEEFFSCRQQLENAVRAEFDETGWVKDFSPDLAIVRTAEYDQTSGETREILVQIPYKVSDGGEVTLDLEKIEKVREQTVFAPVTEQREDTRFGRLSPDEMRLSGAKENFGPSPRVKLSDNEKKFLSPRLAQILRDEEFGGK